VEYLRNIPYTKPQGTIPTKLVASAVLKNGRVWTGLRHAHAMRDAWDDGVGYISQDDQGFWTDDNRFVSRKAAEGIAIKAGQLSPDFNKHTLLSEYLW
jgi:hypothetical protein